MAKPRDDNDRARDGELPLDPLEGTEEVEPPMPPDLKEEIERNQKLLSLNTIAPFGPDLYSLKDLAQDEDRELLSVEDFPLGYGWGPVLNDLMGGGVAPGDFIAIGAASAGAGKTSFLMQLADGLSLRSHQVALGQLEGPLTPVLVLSELSPKALGRRSLAWLTQEKVSTFRAGKSAARPGKEHLVKAAYLDAKRLLTPPNGTLYQIRQWQRQVKPSVLFEQILTERGHTRGAAIVEKLREILRLWRELFSLYPQGNRLKTIEVHPVLVIDPLQRWQERGRNELESLNELSQSLDDAADAEGWILLATSDTNKTSAKGDIEGDPMEKGAALFRGSYTLIHCADVVFYLGRPEGDPRDPTKVIPVQMVKNRYGPAYEHALFSWHGPTGRFSPFDHKKQEQYEAEKKAAESRGKGARGKETVKNGSASYPEREGDV